MSGTFGFLRTTVLALIVFSLLIWVYADNSARLTTSSVAQAAADAAADVTECGVPDNTAVRDQMVAEATAAVERRLRATGGSVLRELDVAGDGCAVIATVTVVGLSARPPLLTHTAFGCATPKRSALPTVELCQ